MAGDWIKMRTDLYDDPRVIRISTITCPQNTREPAHRFGIVGRLFMLWRFADEHSVCGKIPHVTPANLDDMMEMAGWSAALAEVGWIEITSQGLGIPRFSEHNGMSAKRRAQERNRKQEYEETRSRNPRKTRAKPAHESALDIEVEKRREEKTNTSGVPDSSKVAKPATFEPPSSVQGIIFPCVGRGPQEWVLTEDQLAGYQPDYPGLDVRQEALKARRWCDANPTRRKTFRGMPRFLASWFNRAQDTARPAAKPSQGTHMDFSGIKAFLERNGDS